jgi:hypothetical protein
MFSIVEMIPPRLPSSVTWMMLVLLVAGSDLLIGTVRGNSSISGTNRGVYEVFKDPASNIQPLDSSTPELLVGCYYYPCE